MDADHDAYMSFVDIGHMNSMSAFNLSYRRQTPRSNVRSFMENLAMLLETNLPGPPKEYTKGEEQFDCGICYAQYLPHDDELGGDSGNAPDYKCDNPCCSRAFHTVCLRDWLRSITTTRQSFDVLFGNCPYCSDPVAVKSNGS